MNTALANPKKICYRHINRLISHLKSNDLFFNDEDLEALGITSSCQITKVIDKARLSCLLAGLDLSWYFDPYYIGSGLVVHEDWKSSKAALVLALIQASQLENETVETYINTHENNSRYLTLD